MSTVAVPPFPSPIDYPDSDGMPMAENTLQYQWIVTIVTGLPLSAADLETLATKLKKRCGSGGTVRSGVIEIQGEHRDVLVAELVKLGWPAKKSGG